MAEEQPVSLAGAARDSYLRRLETRMEFLHDVISGHEDGWGLEGEELESVVEHLSRAWAVAAAAEIRLIVDRRQPNPQGSEPAPQSANVIPFRPRFIP
jgi:hypothetical protein